MFKNLILSIATVICISLPALAEEHPVITEVKNMAEGPDRGLTLYGLYPGMTRAEAIEVAKQADKVMMLKEDPATKSGILYQNTLPKMQVTIHFFYPEEGPYSNETIRAKSIEIKRGADVRQGRIKAEELSAEIIEQLGEPTILQEKPKNINLTYAIQTDVEENGLWDACHAESGASLSMQSKLAFTSLKGENIDLIQAKCPGIMEDYKTYHAAKLGPLVFAKIEDGRAEAFITMNYKAESYKPPKW